MSAISDLRDEMHQLFQTSQQIQVIAPAQPAEHLPQPEEPRAEPEPELLWEQLLEELPASPPLQEVSWPKVYKLARELKRRASLMTVGRDLHDIHTVIHTAAHWQHLQPATKYYIVHRMRLLYVAITKGWPVALFYDQQGGDEFLDVSPEFWETFQPPQRLRAAQQTGPDPWTICYPPGQREVTALTSTYLYIIPCNFNLYITFNFYYYNQLYLNLIKMKTRHQKWWCAGLPPFGVHAP
jgi:hypothetical protein